MYCSVASADKQEALRKTYPNFSFLQLQRDIEAAIAECDSYVLVSDQVTETLRLLELIKQQEQQKFSKFCCNELGGTSLRLPTTHLFSGKTYSMRNETHLENNTDVSDAQKRHICLLASLNDQSCEQKIIRDKFMILKKRGLIHQESKIITTGLVYDSDPCTTSDSYFQQLARLILQRKLHPVISSELQESINIGLTSTGRTCVGVCSSLGVYGEYSDGSSQSSELVIVDAVVSLSRLLNLIYTTFVHEQRPASQPSTPRSGSRQAKSRQTRKDKKAEEPEEV